MKPSRILPAALCLTVAAACSFDATSPAEGDTAEVRVFVTGGVIPTSFEYRVDTGGTVVGLACASGCDFQSGDTLLRLTPAQRQAFLERLDESGLADSGRPANFGTECCDRLTYRLVYSSGAAVRSFMGGLESLPDPLQRLVRMLDLLYRETPPIVLSQTAGIAAFPADPLTITFARVVDGVLEADVTYGGGCAVHDVDAVVHTSFVDSLPIQVGVALAHDAHADACDALISRSLRFDLEPLRLAYRDAFGSDEGTLHLSLQPAELAGLPSPRILVYTF